MSSAYATIEFRGYIVVSRLCREGRVGGPELFLAELIIINYITLNPLLLPSQVKPETILLTPYLIDLLRYSRLNYLPALELSLSDVALISYFER